MPRTLVTLVLTGILLVTGACASGSYPAKMVRADASAEAAKARLGTGLTAGIFIGDQPATERMVMRSADLSLEVDDVDEAGREIVRLTAEAGGFVLSSARNHYSVKVPAAGLDSSLEHFESIGEVTRRSLSGEDVTSEYMDLEVRLKNAHAARDSYEQIMKKAANVAEVLAVERELNAVQERIELLETRRKYLDDHLALSDVRIGLRERRRAGPLQIFWNVISWPFSKLWWL